MLSSLKKQIFFYQTGKFLPMKINKSTVKTVSLSEDICDRNISYALYHELEVSKIEQHFIFMNSKQIVQFKSNQNKMMSFAGTFNMLHWSMMC